MIRLLALGMADSAVGILVVNYLLVTLGRARIVARSFWLVRGDQGKAASARTDSGCLVAHWNELIADLHAGSSLLCQDLHGAER